MLSLITPSGFSSSRCSRMCLASTTAGVKGAVRIRKASVEAHACVCGYAAWADLEECSAHHGMDYAPIAALKHGCVCSAPNGQQSRVGQRMHTAPCCFSLMCWLFCVILLALSCEVDVLVLCCGRARFVA